MFSVYLLWGPAKKQKYQPLVTRRKRLTVGLQSSFLFGSRAVALRDM